MKKALSIIFTFAILVVSHLALADTQGYFSKQHPLKETTGKASLKAVLVAPTDIIINNASFQTIYVSVPAGGFTDSIYPRGYDHILNQYGALFTRLVFQDANFHTFYDGVFCPHASITIYGPHPADIVVDTKSC